MSTTRRRLQKGETLTGLLVGLSLGLVVLAGGSAMLASQLRGHRQALLLPRGLNRPVDAVPYLAMALYPLPVVDMFAGPECSADALLDQAELFHMWKDRSGGLTCVRAAHPVLLYFFADVPV